MRLAALEVGEHFSASWDHVESVLRHEYHRTGGGGRLMKLIALMREAGFDRRLLARRTLRAPLVLTRSAPRVLGSQDPIIVFVCHHDRIISLVGTIETFRPYEISDGALTTKLARELTRLCKTVGASKRTWPPG
jgi:hypothetical protein